MKAVEIGKGYVLLDEEGSVVYTVLDVRRVGEHVDALVQYEADSGTAWRTWDAGKEVPLKRRPE